MSALIPSKIVIIEDNAETNNLLQEWLKLKFSVVGFLDAEAALRQLVPSDQLTIFLIDYNLPGMDGLQLREKLTSLFPCGKYILISGLFDEALTEKARQTGFDVLIPKPFTMPTVTRKIEELMGIEKTSLLDLVKRENA